MPQLSALQPHQQQPGFHGVGMIASSLQPQPRMQEPSQTNIMSLLLGRVGGQHATSSSLPFATTADHMPNSTLALLQELQQQVWQHQSLMPLPAALPPNAGSGWLEPLVAQLGRGRSQAGSILMPSQLSLTPFLASSQPHPQ
mmetsp:Transcript_14653/g.42972  ORF Transcript_14653/g.42972 Transcript_14653/m.42972 type:complete len:142 (-) Transcript_14653:376-801(-)